MQHLPISRLVIEPQVQEFILILLVVIGLVGVISQLRRAKKRRS
jgi:hypothetical protein